MSTLICPGYKDHPCGKTVERKARNQKICRECSQERKKACSAAYKAAHKEEMKAYSASYYPAHREESRAYYAAHREEIKAHRDAHKEEIRARDAAYRAAHKEEMKARNVAYWAAHKEENKAYKAAHREEIKARTAAYRVAHKEEISVRNHHLWIFGTKKTPPLKRCEGSPFEDAWNPSKGGSFRAGGDWIKANLVRPSGKVSLHIVDHAKGFVPGNLEWTHPVKQNAEQMFKIIARQRHQISRLEKRITELLRDAESVKEAAA